MNERIKELLEQCTSKQMSKPWPLVDTDKFAELLLKECIELVEGFTLEQEVALDVYEEYDAANVLKEHFGVK